MKPIITIYSEGKAELTKKFDNFVHAAYWIGVESAEEALDSAKIRLSPLEDYDCDVANAKDFASLLVERGINFSFEFFVEPLGGGSDAPSFTPPPPHTSNPPPTTETAKGVGRTATREDLKSALEKGIITQKDYDSLVGRD